MKNFMQPEISFERGAADRNAQNTLGSARRALSILSPYKKILHPDQTCGVDPKIVLSTRAK